MAHSTSSYRTRRTKLTVDDLAELAGISSRQVWRDVRRGRLFKPTYGADGARAAYWTAEQTRGWLAWREGRPLCRELAKVLTTFDPARFYGKFPPTFMTVEEVAIRLGVGERTVWRWAAEGMMPRPIPGKKRPRLWRTSEVLQWAADSRKAKGLPPIDDVEPNAIFAKLRSITDPLEA
jgi:excisionase family DNA binding protein